MKVEIKDGKLVIEIPLGVPRPSASGKTLVLASTHGNKATTAQYEGKPIIIGFNAYVQK